MSVSKLFVLIISTICVSVSSYVFAATPAIGEEPIETIVKFKIEGQPSQANPNIFIINGPGYAPVVTADGSILDTVVPGLQIANLSGAEITFTSELNQPVVEFTCLESSCTITFNDGSVLQSDPTVPLMGRLVTKWGPIANSDLNLPSVAPMRILGCGGIREVAHTGRFSDMVGSICFNGVFNVPDFQTNFTLTGGSNCTITMHTPMNLP